MKATIAFAGAAITLAASITPALTAEPEPETVGYHRVHLDRAGRILPWYADEAGKAYDHTLNLIWFYWHHIPPYWDQQVGKPALGAIDLPKYMLFRTLETAGIGATNSP